MIKTAEDDGKIIAGKASPRHDCTSSELSCPQLPSTFFAWRC